METRESRRVERSSTQSFYPGAKEVPRGMTTVTTNGVRTAPTRGRYDDQSCGSECRFVLSDADRDSLFLQFRPLVQRLLRKYADSAERRSDLEGEIFCLFCELLEAFQPERGVPLKAYLVHQLNTSTYTTVRKHWRRERREISLENCDDTPLLDPTSEWDEQLMLNQMRALLPGAIAKLPTRQRQVVLWRYYDHLAFDEIAIRLEVQPATVRSLLRHGINALRRNFRETNLNL
jgi:RNA polymerase sigma factor (sigma-70 family)